MCLDADGGRGKCKPTMGAERGMGMARQATLTDQAERRDLEEAELVGLAGCRDVRGNGRATESAISSDAQPAPDATGGEPPRDALTAFVRAVSTARYASPRLPGWWQAHAVQLEDGRCCFCDASVRDAPMLDPIIPIVAGGPLHQHAAVLCCKGCKLTRGRKDLLNWKPNASPTLQALRMQMALESWNHVTRDPAEMQTKAKAEAVLTRRWSLPRFYCHGAVIDEGGFIGWRDAALVPSSVQLRLVFEHHAWRLRPSRRQTHRRHADSVIFWFPTPHTALNAIWDIVEQNGLVRSVTLGALAASDEGATDPPHEWALLLPTTADLVRRRWRKQR
jgi:hypothetical protein